MQMGDTSLESSHWYMYIDALMQKNWSCISFVLSYPYDKLQIDGLVQDRHNSNANALEFMHWSISSIPIIFNSLRPSDAYMRR